MSIASNVSEPVHASSPRHSAKPLNLTAMSQKYGDGYVARIQGTTRVIAHAKRADDLMKKICDMDESTKKKLVISWVPKHDTTYTFAHLPVSLC